MWMKYSFLELVLCVVVVVGTGCNLPVALSGGVGGTEARSSLFNKGTISRLLARLRRKT